MDLWERVRARRAWRIGAIAVVLGLVALTIAGVQRARRQTAHAKTPANPAQVSDPDSRPVNEWTDRFTALQAAGDWKTLDNELDTIASDEPDLYEWYRLAYLHARAKLAIGEPAEARRLLEPFLAQGHSLRDLALFHAASAEAAAGNAEAAATLREDLVLNHRKGSFRTAPSRTTSSGWPRAGTWTGCARSPRGWPRPRTRRRSAPSRATWSR